MGVNMVDESQELLKNFHKFTDKFCSKSSAFMGAFYILMGTGITLEDWKELEDNMHKSNLAILDDVIFKLSKNTANTKASIKSLQKLTDTIQLVTLDEEEKELPKEYLEMKILLSLSVLLQNLIETTKNENFLLFSNLILKCLERTIEDFLFELYRQNSKG